MKKCRFFMLSVSLPLLSLALHFTPSVQAAATDHVWSDWITDLEPTCIHTGHRYRECLHYPDSPHYEEEVIPPTGIHTYELEEIPATCTDTGADIYTCIYCGDSYQTEIAPLSHDYGEWVIVTEPTPEHDGKKQRVCRHNPAHIEIETIPALAVIATPPPATAVPETPLIIPSPTPVIVEKKARINKIDILLSGLCAVAASSFAGIFWFDWQVLRWDARKKAQLIKERGRFCNVRKQLD